MQRNANNGVVDKHHRMDGNAIPRPRENCSTSGAMEGHDSQPSQRRRHLMMMMMMMVMMMMMMISTHVIFRQIVVTFRCISYLVVFQTDRYTHTIYVAGSCSCPRNIRFAGHAEVGRWSYHVLFIYNAH